MMTESIRNFKKVLIMNIVLMAIIAGAGMLLFIFSDLSTRIIALITGVIFILDGLFCLIKYLYDGFDSKIYTTEIIKCVLNVIFGIFCVFYTKNIINFIGIIFGLWMLVNAIFNGLYGIKFVQEKEEIFPLVLFISALMLVMSIISIVNPFKTFMVITKLISLFIIVYGIFQVLLCLFIQYL